MVGRSSSNPPRSADAPHSCGRGRAFPRIPGDNPPRTTALSLEDLPPKLPARVALVVRVVGLFLSRIRTGGASSEGHLCVSVHLARVRFASQTRRAHRLGRGAKGAAVRHKTRAELGRGVRVPPLPLFPSPGCEHLPPSSAPVPHRRPHFHELQTRGVHTNASARVGRWGDGRCTRATERRNCCSRILRSGALEVADRRGPNPKLSGVRRHPSRWLRSGGRTVQ